MRIITKGAVCALLLLALSVWADDVMHPILSISGSGSGANTVTNIAESDYTNNFIPHSPPRNNSYGFVPAVVSGDTGCGKGLLVTRRESHVGFGFRFTPP